MPKLDEELIEKAKITAFRPTSIDIIINQYKQMLENINNNITVDKELKISKLCNIYNNHLKVLGNNVSEWTAGRANYKSKTINTIDGSIQKMIEFENEIYKEIKQNETKPKGKSKVSLLNDIAYYQDINKTLFYESLVNLYHLDKNTFKLAYKQLENKISSKSKPYRLYKEV